MGNRHLGLIALSQMKAVLRLVLILLSFVYSHDVYANVSLPTSTFKITDPFLNTSIDILNGKNVDKTRSASMPLWEYFGFENAAEMEIKLAELQAAHDRVIEGIAERSATEEKIFEQLPDGFEGLNGITKQDAIKKSKKNIASNSSSSVGNGLIDSLPTPISVNLTTPVAEAEEVSGDIQPCKSGSPCSQLKKSAAEFAEKLEQTVSTLAPTSSGSQIQSTSPNGTNRSKLLEKIASTSSARHGSDRKKNRPSLRNEVQRPINVASASLPSNDTTSSETGGFVANPTIDQLENSGVFEVVPEGWFTQVDKDSGIEIRGALDAPFIKEENGKPNYKNYIQIAVKDKNNKYDLEPGVYTIKKCDIGCFDEQYANFIKNLDEFKNGNTNVKISVPAVVEALTRLNDPFERQKIVSESKANGNILASLLNPKNLRNLVASAKKRETVYSYLSGLRSQDHTYGSTKLADYVNYMLDVSKNLNL